MFWFGVERRGHGYPGRKKCLFWKQRHRTERIQFFAHDVLGALQPMSSGVAESTERPLLGGGGGSQKRRTVRLGPAPFMSLFPLPFAGR